MIAVRSLVASRSLGAGRWDRLWLATGRHGETTREKRGRRDGRTSLPFYFATAGNFLYGTRKCDCRVSFCISLWPWNPSTAAQRLKKEQTVVCWQDLHCCISAVVESPSICLSIWSILKAWYFQKWDRRLQSENQQQNMPILVIAALVVSGIPCLFKLASYWKFWTVICL